MDDEDFVRNAACGMLISSGIEAESSANGEEAEAKYREAYNRGTPYGAVILDLTVKGGTGGRETIKELKKINHDVIAIASSGYSADPVMANPAAYGFADRLIKPYRLDELLTVLNRVTKG
jgi:DNA-binding NtrC family response regulator